MSPYDNNKEQNNTRTYKVFYSAGYGINTSQVQVPYDGAQYNSGQAVTLRSINVFDSKLQFIGWYDGKRTYQAYDSYIMPDSDVTFVAVWYNNNDSSGGNPGDPSETHYYRVSYSLGYGMTGLAPTDYKFYNYGDTVVLADAPVVEGNDFIGWYDGETLYNANAECVIFKDKTFIALWAGSATNKAYYTVEHYQENLNDDEYTLVEEDTTRLLGNIDSLTAAQENYYDGFYRLYFSQETVKADGSTVVRIYYRRDTVSLSFNNCDRLIPSMSVKPGQNITAPENPTRTGYIFKGWSPEFPDTAPSEDTTYTALWEHENNISFMPDYSDFTLSINENNIITATPGFDSNYDWYVDGILEKSRTYNTYTFNKTINGVYTVTVIAYDQVTGSYYSASLQVTVQ